MIESKVLSLFWSNLNIKVFYDERNNLIDFEGQGCGQIWGLIRFVLPLFTKKPFSPQISQ